APPKRRGLLRSAARTSALANGRHHTLAERHSLPLSNGNLRGHLLPSPESRAQLDDEDDGRDLSARESQPERGEHHEHRSDERGQRYGLDSDDVLHSFSLMAVRMAAAVASASALSMLATTMSAIAF